MTKGENDVSGDEGASTVHNGNQGRCTSSPNAFSACMGGQIFVFFEHFQQSWITKGVYDESELDGSCTVHNEKKQGRIYLLPKNSVWIGGQILSSLSTMQQSWITKDEYNEKKK